MLNLIKSTADISLANGIKLLIYGQSGFGKTRLLASAPQPNLILSAEGGLLSLKKVYRETGLYIPYLDIKNLYDLQQARYWLYTSREALQFPVISVDSISDVAETVLTAEKQRLGKKADAFGKAYGEMADLVETEMRYMRDLPGRSIIMLAKQGVVSDELNRRYAGPDFPARTV